jgi:arginine/serine-rich splicing factor 16
MWHQARTNERKLRGTMIDYRKRAERRRAHQKRLVCQQHRSFRISRVLTDLNFAQLQDPFQQIRINGRKSELHINAGEREDVETGKNLVPWQGQSDNMIDRYRCAPSLHLLCTLPPSCTCRQRLIA